MMLTPAAMSVKPFREYGDFGFSIKSLVSNIGAKIDPTKAGSVLNVAAGKISPGLQTALTTTGELNKGGGGGAAPGPGPVLTAGPGGITIPRQKKGSFFTTYKWPLLGAGTLIALGIGFALYRASSRAR